MLSVFSLDDETFETIRNRAIRSIAGYQKEWTNYNASDTGIALLELLAWMQEMQLFYLEHDRDGQEYLYLELLGMEPKKLTPASVYVHMSPYQSGRIHKNTGFYVGSLCFEPIRRGIAGMEVLRFCCTRSREDRLLWKCSEPEQLSRGVWLFGEHPEPGTSCYMGFDRPFLPEFIHTIYLELEASEENGRNPVGTKTKGLFSRYRLEFWSNNSWKRCKIIQDETCGFLQSGCIDWMAEGEWEKAEQLYWIRFRLTACAYDIPPRLINADTHCIRLLQKETLTTSEQMILPVQEEGVYIINLEEYFDAAEEIEVFLKSGEQYRKTDAWIRQDAKLELYCYEKEGAFLTVLLISARKHSKIPVCWEATGFPEQTIDFEDSGILSSQLRVLVETEYNSGIYRFWHPVPHLWNAGAEEECYCFQETEGRLLFGNGEHGAIPEGRIYLTDCVRSLGEEGTIKENQQFQWKYGTAYNPDTAKPGTPAETNRECLSRISKVMQAHRRAVTEEDYEAIVKQTPGLIIKRVKAISDKQGENSMTLVIEGGGKKATGKLHPIYQREIRSWLEDKRILGTRLKLEPPVYIPVSIRTEIVIYERFHQAEQWIRRVLEDYIRYDMADFGAKLKFSHLYGKLDGLSCVAEIKNLNAYASGKGIHMHRDGGFTLPEQGLAVLGDIQIQLVTDTKE